MVATSNTLPPQKSVFITYVLWLFGGFFGIHHLYLGRDIQAFVWWCTLGGYFGIGWLFEVRKIPHLVRDTNEDPEFIKKFVERLRKHQRPPFSSNRFLLGFMVSYLWGQVYQMAIPQSEFAGIDWGFLHWGIPFFIALGAWAVGNIGREKGPLKHALLTAYLTYLSRYWLYDETYWMTLTVFTTLLAFDYFSKEWRREPPKRYSFKRRVACVGGAITLYLYFWGCFFYFNGTITDSDGDEVPINEALKNFFASPWWTDLKSTLDQTWQYAQHHGWYEIWKQIIDTMDMDGEQNAFKVLNLSATASQTEITTAWRKLSKENHPDKVKDESKRREAQDKFMEIQQAYEVLSKLKSNRRRRNKQFNDDL